MKEKILFVDNEWEEKKLKPLIAFLDEQYTLLSPQATINGARSLFKYDKNSIDCIILDVHFGSSEPEGGIKLLQKMRETDPYIPIGMITEFNQGGTAFSAGKNLATFYLPKEWEGEAIKEEFIKKLDNEIKSSIKNSTFLYDRELMQKVNDNLAITYDAEEYSKQGTLGFCYWENEIIVKALKNLPNDKINILDVGCGTGRYEVLIKQLCPEPYQMEAIDFSGMMLHIARRKLEKIGLYPEASKESDRQVNLNRGFAEKLPFSEGKFDFVICGFGVPSYTKFNLSLPEANRVLRKGGLAVFSVYNKNALFNKVAKGFFPSSKHNCPMASWVKFEGFNGHKKEGVYKLVPQGREEIAFRIQPFSKNEFSGILNRFGFKVKHIGTFPILYSITPTDLINKPDNDTEFKNKCFTKGNEYLIPTEEEFRNLCDDCGIGKSETDRLVTEYNKYYEKGKEQNKSFSWRFYQLDKDYCQRIEDGGFYITVVAEKVLDAEKVNFYVEKSL